MLHRVYARAPVREYVLHPIGIHRANYIVLQSLHAWGVFQPGQEFRRGVDQTWSQYTYLLHLKSL
jgi:hypothetical protein